MIKLNKIAIELWSITEERKQLGRDSSIAAALVRISAKWRKLYRRNKAEPASSHITYVEGKKPPRDDEEETSEENLLKDMGYSTMEKEAADIILESINLLTLLECKNIENLLRKRMVERGGKPERIY